VVEVVASTSTSLWWCIGLDLPPRRVLGLPPRCGGDGLVVVAATKQVGQEWRVAVEGCGREPRRLDGGPAVRLVG
jgi:hypothetical protein